MELVVPNQHDRRHLLPPTEHEVFYFVFTLADGSVFGYVRTLFSHEDVLEMVALRTEAQTWVYQARTPWPPPESPVFEGSGPRVKLRGRIPWQAWEIRFEGTVREITQNEERPLSISFEFTTSMQPAIHQFQRYYQGEQSSGNYSGTLALGGQQWKGPWSGGRDHTWGERPMTAVVSTVGIVIPDRYYAILFQTPQELVKFGRSRNAEGSWQPIGDPVYRGDEQGGEVEDPAAGLDLWQVRRLAAPLSSYYGRAGHEGVRAHPEPGDWMRNDMGPALYRNSPGESIVGFLDQTRRIIP